MSALLEAALALAGDFGWRVHPCRPGGKVPLLEAWQKRATTDRRLIERWWGRTPDANVGVVTGAGLLVLDVDGIEGERSLAELERQHGDMPDLYPQSWTGGGRGGWQAFFALPPGRELGNSAGRLGRGIDTRGEGGYVVAPPSATVEAYRWADDRSPWDLPLEPCPDWLVDLLDPPSPPEPDRFDPFRYRKGGGAGHNNAYAWKALESELALIATATEGRRNDQLNASAHALFRLVADGRLYRTDVDEGLAAAARHAGLTEREILATINSAARARGLTP